MNGVSWAIGRAAGISANFACTVAGDGGCTRTAGFTGGVGGYECVDNSPVKVTSESTELLGRELPAAAAGGEAFVRHLNVSAASL